MTEHALVPMAERCFFLVLNITDIQEERLPLSGIETSFKVLYGQMSRATLYDRLAHLVLHVLFYSRPGPTRRQCRSFTGNQNISLLILSISAETASYTPGKVDIPSPWVVLGIKNLVP